MLDHIYVKNIASETNVYFKVPAFVDHVVLAITELNLKPNLDTKVTCIRNWKNYSATFTKLCEPIVA